MLIGNGMFSMWLRGFVFGDVKFSLLLLCMIVIFLILIEFGFLCIMCIYW